MRDDDRILRDVEKTSEQTRAKGRMAILERELELVPLSGEPSIVDAAREARYRIMGELFAGEEPLVIRSGGMYSRPLDILHGHLLSVLKTKNAQFWFQHRDSIPEEVALSELFELKPIARDSPLLTDARSARNRLLWTLLHLRWIEEEAFASGILQWIKQAASVIIDRSLRSNRIIQAQNKNIEVVMMAGEVLSQKDAQFWHEHKDFEVEELVKLHFPDIQNWMTPSERKSYRLKGVMCLVGAAASFLIGIVVAISSEMLAGMAVGCCVVAAPVALLVPGLAMYFRAKRNPYGNDLIEGSLTEDSNE